MDVILNFLRMGGYAGWVWPAYGLATTALVGILVFTLRGLRAREREFEEIRAMRRGGNNAPFDNSRALAARDDEGEHA
mgnify:CR=1 FL=1